MRSSIRFWEAWSGLCSRTISHADSAVNTLALSPDKHWLAAGGYGKIRVYDCTSEGRDGPIVEYAAHSGNVTSLAWHIDARWLASASEDGTVKIWDMRLPSHKPSRTYFHDHPVNDLAVHPNQGDVIACDQAGSVKIWDLAQNSCSHDLWPSESSSVPIRSVSVAQDGTFLCAAAQSGVVYIWKFDHNGERNEPFELLPAHRFDAHPPTDYLTKCRISPDSNWLATTSSDKSIRIWNASGGFNLDMVLEGHQRWVWDVAFSADSAYVVSSSSDGTARLWDLSTGTTVRRYRGHTKALIAVALNDAHWLPPGVA